MQYRVLKNVTFVFLVLICICGANSKHKETIRLSDYDIKYEEKYIDPIENCIIKNLGEVLHVR